MIKNKWLVLAGACIALSLRIAITDVTPTILYADKFSEMMDRHLAFDIFCAIMYQGLGYYCFYKHMLGTKDEIPNN